MNLGVRSMTWGVSLEQELGDEFGGDFSEFGAVHLRCVFVSCTRVRVFACVLGWAEQ